MRHDSGWGPLERAEPSLPPWRRPSGAGAPSGCQSVNHNSGTVTGLGPDALAPLETPRYASCSPSPGGSAGRAACSWEMDVRLVPRAQVLGESDSGWVSRWGTTTYMTLTRLRPTGRFSRFARAR